MDLAEFIKRIPKILSMDMSPEKMLAFVQGEFSVSLECDFSLIAYLSVDGVDIKTCQNDVSDVINPTDDIVFGAKINDFIKNKKILNKSYKKNEASVLTEMGFESEKDYSLLVIPLCVKTTIFGFILAANIENKFSKEQCDMGNVYAALCAYTVKDAELADVCKAQLKILNQNVIKKNETIAEIEEKNKKIAEAEKLKTEFLMSMSHALRTPLNAIIGFSEALEMEVFGPMNDKQKEYILDIQNNGKELLGLVNDILDMSKLEAHAMKVCKEPMDLCLIITEVIRNVLSLANKKNIDLTSKFDKEVCVINADQQKISQIMYNLLSNAIKFTHENGKIEVGLESNDEEYVTVYVKDNGVGIDKKYHGKIFGKFEQVDNTYTKKYSSTGIGLAITKELVEIHGGKISVESKLNEGTTFYFTLPVE